MPKKLRIAIFTDSFRTDMGGGTKVVLDLATGLKKKGHEVLIVTGQSVNEELVKEFKVLRLLSIKYPFYENAEVIIPTPELSDSIQEFNPDVIHYHDPFMAGLIAILMAKHFKKKVVGTIHIDPLHLSQYALKLDKGSLAKLLVGFFSKKSDRLIFVSHYQRKTYSSFLGNKESSVIYPGIPDYFFSNRKPQFVKRVITVSRLAPEKNLSFAVKVMALVQRKTGAEYVVVGEGKERGQLEKLSKKLGLKVKFLGRVKRENLPKLHRESSVFFLPSKTETFGLVFAEAMACGLPVVALNFGSAPEVVGDAGIVCRESIREVVKSISKLLCNKKLWLKKVKIAKERARVFSMKEFIENHERVYKSLLF